MSESVYPAAPQYAVYETLPKFPHWDSRLLPPRETHPDLAAASDAAERHQRAQTCRRRFWCVDRITETAPGCFTVRPRVYVAGQEDHQ